MGNLIQKIKEVGSDTKEWFEKKKFEVLIEGYFKATVMFAENKASKSGLSVPYPINFFYKNEEITMKHDGKTTIYNEKTEVNNLADHKKAINIFKHFCKTFNSEWLSISITSKTTYFFKFSSGYTFRNY